MIDWLVSDATGMIWLSLKLVFCAATALFSLINIRWTIIVLQVGYIYSAIWVAGIDEPGMRSVVLVAIMLMIINLYQIFRYHYERNIQILPKEYRDIYNDLFEVFTPYEFLQIIKHASQSSQPGLLITKGVRLSKLYLLLDGAATIKVGNTEICLKAPHFLGDMAFVSKSPANANVIIQEGSHFIVFSAESIATLRQIIDRFDERLNYMIASDLANKIQLANSQT